MIQRRWLRVGAALLALGCERDATTTTPPPPDPAPAAADVASAPHFVGVEKCATCHAAETAAWRTSHHAAAMQEANADAVLGRDATVAEGSTETRIERRDGRVFAHAIGPDGTAREYPALYTFGVHPLQQLLLPLDRGRLQATTAAWDSRSAAEGGQRWFALHGDETLPPSDVLHWSGPAQRWNSMCAECHSTDVRKGYTIASDSYETKWGEIAVACEACHGPGSRHVAWAETPAATRGAERGFAASLASDGATWVFDEGAPIARRSAPRRSDAEIESCAPCHSRRSLLEASPVPGGRFLDGHRPALLEAGLYAVDGQIEDEVYEWGSFLQSRMHAAGVACSDCHEPHAGTLRAEGNVVCAGCHRPEVFDVPSHHRHAAGSEAARCVACHMPTRTYMVVDARHDHSIRVPRPDLSVALGTRNACNDCHAERSPAWAASAVERWYGPERRREPHFGVALHAARTGAVGAGEALAGVIGDPSQPAIARATALAELGAWLDPAVAPALSQGLRDADPLLRFGAVQGARGIPPEQRVGELAPLLRDPLRAVRIEAARALTDTPAAQWSPRNRAAFADALGEWRAARLADADRPEAHVDLGALHVELGERAEARAAYETALRIGPWFVPAYLNLADLLREEGRDDEGEKLLRRAIELAPASAEAHHALGLLLVRRQQLPAALDELARAAELAPDDPRAVSVYAIGLHSAGEGERAIEMLEAFRAKRPGDRSVVQLLEEMRAPSPP